MSAVKWTDRGDLGAVVRAVGSKCEDFKDGGMLRWPRPPLPELGYQVSIVADDGTTLHSVVGFTDDKVGLGPAEFRS